MNILISLRSEILKTRRTASIYFTVIAAAIIPLIYLLDISLGGISPENRRDPFNALFREGFTVTCLLILPMYVVLICTLLPQIEYRNNAWKQVFASPQTMVHVFIAKFINVHLLILLFLVSFNVFMAIIAVAAHFIDPSLNLLNQPLNKSALWSFNVNAYLAIVAISAIQFWIGLRFKNFIIPLAIGFCMWVIAAMIVLEFNMDKANFFPFTYPIYSVFPKYKLQLTSIQLSSVGYAALFLIIGFIDFRRRRIKV